MKISELKQICSWPDIVEVGILCLVYLVLNFWAFTLIIPHLILKIKYYMNQAYKSHYITSPTFLSFIFFSNKHKFSTHLFSVSNLIHLIQTISLSLSLLFFYIFSLPHLPSHHPNKGLSA